MDCKWDFLKKPYGDWGLMTLIAWISKRSKWNLWVGNVIGAPLFRVSHIPALYALLKDITTLLILRTIVLNMVAALLRMLLY